MAVSIQALGYSPSGEDVDYQVDDEAFEGYFVKAKGTPRGSVLLVHDWDGIDDYERERADMLAEQGFDTFAVDLFGEGHRPQAMEEKQAATQALYDDRQRMRELTQAGLDQAHALGAATGTIVLGYCFGGAVALEMAREGNTDGIAAYASFHGGLETPEGQGYSSDTAPLFIAHGGTDESVSLQDVASFADELEQAGLNYEIGIYSGAPHAFSVFGSDRYDQQADERSWHTFLAWLDETL